MAIVASELIQYYGVRLLMYPQYAWGKWLDLHAQQAGLTRKPAAPARGRPTLWGEADTRIAQGTMFCTADFGDGASFTFLTEEETVIPVDGRTAVAVTAAEGGSKGNVAAGTITLILKPFKGVRSVSNEEVMLGGSDVETDVELYKRIELEYEGGRYSYVGNDRDYIRWPERCPGSRTAL